MSDPSRVLSSTKLPSVPSIALQLLELSRDPNVPVAEFCHVIRTDPALSVKIVKTANSPYFGLTSKVTSVEAAVPLLGSTVVTSLALSFSLILEERTTGSLKDYFERYWSQSLLQAVTAETVARRRHTGNPSACFLGGLLCDIGILASLYAIPEEYVPTLDAWRQSTLSLAEVEQDRLGFDHIQIGTQLMHDWGMPLLLQQATRIHHESPEAISPPVSDNPDHVSSLRSIRFATYLSELLLGQQYSQTDADFRAYALEHFRFDGPALDGFMEEMHARTKDAARLMSVRTDSLPLPSEILSQANVQLAEIALREHVAKTEVTAKTAALEQENRNLKKRNTELNEQAGIDALTGLANRSVFEETFLEAIAACVTSRQPLGIIFADVDYFKDLNDTYGHPFGDEVLRRVGAILRSQVRDSDCAARYGGEEFVVITPRCPAGVVSAIAERIRSKVADEPFAHPLGAPRVTVSVGACVVPPDVLRTLSDTTIAATIIQEADNAMYHAKRNGKNRVQICSLDAASTPVPAPMRPAQ